MDDLVNEAILCARNNNLEGLEKALDSGADPNSRDNYGNTLSILVYQQGNKRLAKFLLRRRADMNLQNMNGNTGLHYLYKHKELAEYLKTKGAIDTIQNVSGLTCYEGLSTEKLDQS
ncbi:Acyl-coa-binding protein, partial [Globisporangium splendens]